MKNDPTPTLDSWALLAGAATAPGLHLGWLAPGSRANALFVRRDNDEAPLPALSLVALTPSALADAVARKQIAVFMIAEGPPRTAVLLGLVQSPTPTPGIDALLEGEAPRRDEIITTREPDGTLVVESERELVLRCGLASVTLRRDGKLSLRGVQIESDADSVNRIKGGVVKIN